MQKFLKGSLCLLLIVITFISLLPAALAEGSEATEKKEEPAGPAPAETAAPSVEASTPPAAEAAPPAPPAPAPAPAQPKMVSTPKAAGYRLSPSGEIKEGGSVELTVRVLNESILTSQIPASSLQPEITAFNVRPGGGSFTVSGKPVVTVDSKGNEPLSISIVFSGCVYSGKGNRFRFELSYPDFPGLAADAMELAVKECRETQPIAPTPDGKEPLLQISRGDLAESLSPGQEATLRLTVKNLSKTVGVKSPVLTLSPSSGLMLAENTSTFPLKDIDPEKSQTMDVKIKALSEIPSQSQALDVRVKFVYEADGKRQDGTASEKVPIPAKATGGNSTESGTEASPGVGMGGGSYTPVDSPVPNVIISRYTFGSEPQVPVGSKFTLSLEFFNTSSKMKVENLMMTIDPGEGFALNASSNTFFFDGMKKGEKRSQEIPMLVLPSIKTNTQDVTVTFKYEYVDHRKRTSVTLPQKISVPVFQPDRFEITAPTLPAAVAVGEEATISLPFFNKGKSDISNVSAVLTGEINALTKLQNLGNYEPGKSGTIDFILTPDQSGSFPLTITVSYETSSGEAKSKEFPLTLEIAEPAPDADALMYEGELQDGNGGKSKLLLPILILVGILGAVLLLILVLKAKKKRTKPRSQPSYTWEDNALFDDDAPRMEEDGGEAEEHDANT